MTSMRCIGGPYAGQTFELNIAWDWIHWKSDGRWIFPLMWIQHGHDKHCYVVEGSYYDGFRLRYGDTF